MSPVRRHGSSVDQCRHLRGRRFVHKPFQCPASSMLAKSTGFPYNLGSFQVVAGQQHATNKKLSPLAQLASGDSGALKVTLQQLVGGRRPRVEGTAQGS